MADEDVATALGVALHTAWAIVTVVAVPAAGRPAALLDRRRIELTGAGCPAQAYHAAAAAGLGPAEAAALIERCATAGSVMAGRGLAAALGVARAGGSPVACGIAGEERELPPLAASLRSHTLLHAAEGQLARAVVADAAAALGLATSHVTARAAAEPAVLAALAELGQAAGRPWTADHRSAAAAALAALRRVRGGR